MENLEGEQSQLDGIEYILSKIKKKDMTKQELEILEELKRLEMFLSIHPECDSDSEMGDRLNGLRWVIQLLTA